MPRGVETVSDSRIEAQSVGSRPTGDLGGDLARNQGVDLNSSYPNFMKPAGYDTNHAEQFQFHMQETMRGSAEYVANNPVQAHDKPWSYGTKMAFNQRENITNAAKTFSPALMEVTARQHGESSASQLTKLETQMGHEAAIDATGRTEPIEPLQDGQHYYNEDGVRVTDSRYDLGNMTLEKIDEIKNSNDPLHPDKKWQPPETNESVTDDLNTGADEPTYDTYSEDTQNDVGGDLNAGSDSSTNDTPVDDVLTEDATADDTQTEDAQTDDVPAEDIPTDDAPTEDTPTDDVPAEDTPMDDMSGADMAG